MSRLYTGRWTPSTVTMKFVDNGECPFDPQLAAGWIEHLCDLLSFLTRKQFIYGGIGQDTREEGVIYHKYVPTADTEFWAWAYRRMDLPRTDVVGGLCQYRADKMPSPEHFAGLCLHETLHCLGVKHYNDRPSIMNNEPYQGHPWQASPMATDFYTLMLLFGGPMAPLWPCAFDYGDLSKEKCLIHIPSIMWQPGSYASVWLYGFQEDGNWILEAPNYAIQHQGYMGRPVASLSNDVLNIPLRYKGSTVEVVAPIREFSGPSSKVRFEVTEINPLHIHSAFDWVH